MLLRILGRYTRPYRGAIAVIVALQFVASIMNLLLPSINADIIDLGIVRGDTGFIVRQGGWMLLVSLLQVATTVAAVFLGARAAILDVVGLCAGKRARCQAHDHQGRCNAQELLLLHGDTPLVVSSRSLR